MTSIIGIDLGTTNTCAAFVSNKIPRVIPTSAGFNTMPSVVTYLRDGSEFVGQTAKDHIVSHPEHTVHEVKRLIGRQFSSPAVQELIDRLRYPIIAGAQGEAEIGVQGRRLHPVDVQATLLRQIKRYAEIHLGEEVPEAVLAVPAYFTDRQRAWVKEAGTRGGFRIRRIVNEPTAAALAYGFNRCFTQRVLVYDFGGGTFDVSVLQLNGNYFEVIATAGDVFLGGADFDDRVVAWIVNAFAARTRIDLLDDAVAMQKVRSAAERAKIELSVLANTRIRIPEVVERKGKFVDLDLVLDRTTLNGMVEDLVQRSLDVIDTLLWQRGLAKSDIDEIVLVGGQTRMPLVIEAISSMFGKTPRKGVHPDECVAIGAALLGDSLTMSDSVTLTDALSIPIGIATPDGQFQIVLDKHSALPHNGICEVPTARDNQTEIDIDVFQGQSTQVSESEYLGTVQLRDVPPAPAGTAQVRLEMAMDAEGMLEIKASTGESEARRIELSTIKRPFRSENANPSLFNDSMLEAKASSQGGIRGLVKNFFG